MISWLFPFWISYFFFPLAILIVNLPDCTGEGVYQTIWLGCCCALTHWQEPDREDPQTFPALPFLRSCW